jgi:hypothetical protein
MKINNLILINILLLTCCKDIYDTTTIVVNNSETAIYCTTGDYYVDSSYVFTNYNPTNNVRHHKIEPHDTLRRFFSVDWKNLYGENDTIAFYFFDADVMENTPWETVKKEYLVLYRYDLTLENLRTLNWVIPYPPTRAMKDMYIHPPYQEE